MPHQLVARTQNLERRLRRAAKQLSQLDVLSPRFRPTIVECASQRTASWGVNTPTSCETIVPVTVLTFQDGSFRMSFGRPVTLRETVASMSPNR